MAQRVGEIERLNLIMGMQCNVRCVMCFLDTHSLRQVMAPEIYREHLRELYPSVRCIKIQGGEPTIMPVCREALAFFERFPHIRFELYSNGISVDHFWQDVFRQRTDYLNISLNAASRQTYDRIVRFGDFQRVRRTVEGIAGAKAKNAPRIAISAVVLKHNVHELAAFVRLGKELGADVATFFLDPSVSFVGVSRAQLCREIDKVLPLQGQGIEVKGLEVLAAYAGHPYGSTPRKEEKCLRPFSNLMVDHRGDVRVCSLAWRVLGNTYKTSIQDIIGRRQRRRYQEKIGCGDYSWCAPHCLENPRPVARLPWDKYFYLLRSAPRELCAHALHRVSRRSLIGAR